MYANKHAIDRIFVRTRKIFSLDTVCHAVFSCYNKFEDGPTHILTPTPRLIFPFTSFPPSSRLCFQYFYINNLSAFRCKYFYEHILDQYNLPQTTPSDFLCTTLFTVRSLQIYCDNFKKLDVVQKGWRWALISLPLCTTNDAACFFCNRGLLHRFWDERNGRLQSFLFNSHITVKEKAFIEHSRTPMYTRATASILRVDTSSFSISTEIEPQWKNLVRKESPCIAKGFQIYVHNPKHCSVFVSLRQKGPLRQLYQIKNDDY